ncbi:GvpL/GvpF family gas vesicle protein [Sulfitobacter sp. JB4-11]|uniref:GvpL/GvpF family gas vesicle protein n=1 Tax=Sulfitobacter rhodophyticola TaxID=3238304 RepID=UPI0035181455
MTSPVLQLHGLMARRPRRVPSPHAHRILRLGPLSALVSRCPHDGALDGIEPSAMAARAMAHHELLLGYCETAPLLPTRFGAFFSSIHAMRQSINEDAERHLDTLEQLADRHEFAVKLTLANKDMVPAQHDEKPRTGAQFLAHRRIARNARKSVGAMRKQFTQDLSHALQTLGPITAYTTQDALLHVGILLPRQKRDRLKTTVEQFASKSEMLNLCLQLVGPWPAYSFVADERAVENCDGG